MSGCVFYLLEFLLSFGRNFLLYKEQHGYRTGRGNSLSVSLEQMCMRGLRKSGVCPAWMDTPADVLALTVSRHVACLGPDSLGALADAPPPLSLPG